MRPIPTNKGIAFDLLDCELYIQYPSSKDFEFLAGDVWVLFLWIVQIDTQLHIQPIANLPGHSLPLRGRSSKLSSRVSLGSM